MSKEITLSKPLVLAVTDSPSKTDQLTSARPATPAILARESVTELKVPKGAKISFDPKGPLLDPIRFVQFSAPTLIPGYPSAYTKLALDSDKPNGVSWGSSVGYVKTLHIYHNRILVDGEFYMPTESGIIVGYKY